MGMQMGHFYVLFYALFLCASCRSYALEFKANQTARFLVDVSRQSGRKMPENMFGITFEELNHAGAGGLWAELVSNREYLTGKDLKGGSAYKVVGLGELNSFTDNLRRTAYSGFYHYWTKFELQLKSKGANINSRLQVTTIKKGVFWFDQVSVMTLDTYKVVVTLKVDGLEMLSGGQKQLVPGRRGLVTGDIWKYWTDDGLGYFEFIQLAEDLGATTVWVINNGNYLKFHDGIKAIYPDIKIISNCDGSSRPLDHPTDLYNFHVYTSASNMFSMVHQFDGASRSGPKAFVSEYAVHGRDAGMGSLLAALAEASFLIGIEKNRSCGGAFRGRGAIVRRSGVSVAGGRASILVPCVFSIGHVFL